MPKAKPVSLFPLTFDEAMKRLLSVNPSQLRIPSKLPQRKRRGIKKRK